MYRFAVRTEPLRSRAPWLLLAGALTAASSSAQQPPAVTEVVEVREVGVVADLPVKMRGLSAAELAARLVIYEDGATRQPTSVVALATGGFERVLVALDAKHCDDGLVAAAAAALGGQAAQLSRLGPVEVARIGEKEETLLAPTNEAETIAAALARLAASPDCRAADELAPGPPPALGRIECPRGNCLLAWIGPGWESRENGVAAPASRQELDPLVRRLAGDGWTVLALPVARRDPAATKRAGKEPETRPGSKDQVWTINLLARDHGKGQPLSPADYDRFLDVWMAPLRRLTAATAGELARWDDEVAARLEAVVGRSVLYYRTDRPASGLPAAVEVHEAGADGKLVRTSEWAPERPR